MEIIGDKNVPISKVGKGTYTTKLLKKDSNFRGTHILYTMLAS
jgi:hypothetical protein